MKVVLLTGSELRHTFFRKFIGLSKGIQILRTYCEGEENALKAVVAKQPGDHSLRNAHLASRDQSEIDFFRLFIDHSADHSNPLFLPRSEINQLSHVKNIVDLKPELILAYGCSLIKPPLIEHFRGRFLNVHLGLSPYYRGSGTNYWPLVNGEPEYVGATFMFIDPGVDTGQIIHQIRARIFSGDSPADIGNRLIVDMAKVYRDIVLNFSSLKHMPPLPELLSHRYYKNADFSEDSVKKLYADLRNGMLDRYVEQAKERRAKVPIVENPALRTAL